ncbi:hypothetical protein NPIL_82811 [Nephila pilipes]|uniref:Uncharacterized protein n=1 Tax=Nephila pilipes TaxID=299642 RepID=A0A8X6PFR9_NEPPI|nr:hypothetical protein NPIL_82811 [Nephila pilipes]
MCSVVLEGVRNTARLVCLVRFSGLAQLVVSMRCAVVASKRMLCLLEIAIVSPDAPFPSRETQFPSARVPKDFRAVGLGLEWLVAEGTFPQQGHPLAYSAARTGRVPKNQRRYLRI